jgi:hypothetical protein
MPQLIAKPLGHIIVQILSQNYYSLSLQHIQKIMEGAILHTDSDKDLSLILQLAKKLGISARKLTKAEIEDYGLSIAISEGKSGEYIDTESFLRELRDGDQD